MAIVDDKAGVRPGRPGNIPLRDPRNRSTKERSTTDDSYSRQSNVGLGIGNQLLLVADETRNQLLFITPEDAAPVFLSSNPMSSAAGIPIYGGVGLQLRGKACELSYYVYATESVVLTVLIG